MAYGRLFAPAEQRLVAAIFIGCAEQPLVCGLLRRRALHLGRSGEILGTSEQVAVFLDDLGGFDLGRGGVPEQTAPIFA